MADSKQTALTSTLEQVISAAQALPVEKDLLAIRREAELASTRGYYLPDEDDRLRVVYSDYLRVRAILLDTIYNLPTLSQPKKGWEENTEAFSIAYTAACALIRAASYIIEIAKSMPVIWNKLDEAEERFGIKRKSLTRLYKSSTSPLRMWRFFEATRFYEANKESIKSLRTRSHLHEELISLLEEEEPFIEARRRLFIRKRFKFQLYDMIRRHKSGYRIAMFHLFRLSGSAIAEMKQPFRKERHSHSTKKCVTPEIIEQIEPLLEPGDILITRHNDALSNLFLPGFWPHAAFYAGGEDKDRVVIESKKDGVKFRRLEETLYVDCFLVIRPKLTQDAILAVIDKAKTHVGKRYDFLFDFTKSNRLACTELVYRSYHATADIQFELIERAGRKCLSAEDLINQAIGRQQFDCVALFGLTGEEISLQPDALELLRSSYTSQW